MQRTIRAVAGLCVLTATLFVGGALAGSPAGAQECGGYFGPPCEEDVLEFEYPACVEAGEAFTVTGSVTPADAASADDAIDFDIDGESVGSLDIDDDGTFSGSLTAPNLALGDYTITGVTGELSASGDISVCDDSNVGPGGGNNNGGPGSNGGTGGVGNGNGNASGGTGSGALARTGFDSVPMITLGAAVVILGAAAVYGSKRRRMA